MTPHLCMKGVSVSIFHMKKPRLGKFKGFAQILTSFEWQSWWLSPTVSVGVGFLTRPCHHNPGWAHQTHILTTSPNTFIVCGVLSATFRRLVESLGLHGPPYSPRTVWLFCEGAGGDRGLPPLRARH